jgi:hypothetical protein
MQALRSTRCTSAAPARYVPACTGVPACAARSNQDLGCSPHVSASVSACTGSAAIPWTRVANRSRGRNGRSASARSVICAASRWGTRDLLTGDFLILTSFCLYKQIMAITMQPTFQGWLAPLHFSPLRFEELVGFVLTTAGTWIGCAYLSGDYHAGSPGAAARLSPFCPCVAPTKTLLSCLSRALSGFFCSSLTPSALGTEASRESGGRGGEMEVHWVS